MSLRANQLCQDCFKRPGSKSPNQLALCGVPGSGVHYVLLFTAIVVDSESDGVRVASTIANT